MRNNLKPTLYAGLGLLGQAAALQLIFAGPTIHYQHYRIGFELFRPPTIYALFFIALQSGLVFWGLWKYWPDIRQAIISSFKTWQIIVLSILIFISSAALSRVYTDYFLELIFSTFIQFINLATILLAVFFIPNNSLSLLQDRLLKIFPFTLKASDDRRLQIDWFSTGCFIWVLLITSMLSTYIYQRHPHVQDEVIYLWQARYFSQGMLTTPAPLAPDGFHIYMIPYREARWYSPFPPGWPALLSLGVIAKIPWLVNPLLSGINIILASLLFRSLFSIRYARLATLLLAFSPWFLFMGMNLMSHTFMLTCALAGGFAILKAVRLQKTIWAVSAGIFIGLLSLIRPMDSLVVGGLFGLLVLLFSSRNVRVRLLTGYLVTGVIVGGLVLPYNQAVTGNAFKLPLNKYYEDYYGPNTYALGFGPDRGINWEIDPIPGYSPIEAIMNAALNTFSVNIELFGWSCGSLILFYLLLVWGYKSLTKVDIFFIAFILATLGLYALFWFSGGPDFGARYWYLTIFPLIYLSVRSIQLMEEKKDYQLSNVLGDRIFPAVLLASVLSLLIFLPWRAFDKYYEYLDMRPDIRSLVTELPVGKSIVIVQGRSHPDYESAWTYNPLDYREDAALFAFDRDSSVRKEVLTAYSDRPVWIVQGPTITGDSYKIVAGPLTTDEAVKLLDK